MSEDQQGSLCREHIDLHAGEFGYMLSPDTSCVDCDRSVILFLLLGDMVVYNDSFYSVTLLDEAGHFAVYQYFGSMKLGVNDVCRSKTERVYRSVRDLYRSYNVRIC